MYVYDNVRIFSFAMEYILTGFVYLAELIAVTTSDMRNFIGHIRHTVLKRN